MTRLPLLATSRKVHGNPKKTPRKPAENPKKIPNKAQGNPQEAPMEPPGKEIDSCDLSFASTKTK